MAALKPQDVVVAVKVFILEGRKWSFQTAATSLGLSSVSVVHQAFTRGRRAGLYYQTSAGWRVNKPRLRDLLAHGVPSMYYPIQGPATSGVETGPAASPVKMYFPPAGKGYPRSVWPKIGKQSTTGESLEPIHACVPEAALADDRLHEIFALVDVVRLMTGKERKIAVELLERIISGKGSDAPDDVLEETMNR